MLLGREWQAGVIHECSPVCACKCAACDLVSKQPFPWNNATCTLLRPADCIQERTTHKERSTHFTLEEVGWFSDMSASRLPEYSSLVVSRVNGKVIGNVTSIFCHTVTYLGTDQCCWEGNHRPGWFMNVRQYVLVNVQLVIWFQSSLSHETMQPARCCALQIASKKGLHTRKGARLTSHMKNLGGSLTCLLQDCLSIPHLSWAQSTESRLPMLEASSATVSHISGQSNAAGIGIICQGDSWMFHSTCWKGLSKNLVSSEPFPYALATCTLLCHAAASKKLFDKRTEELLTSHLNELGDSLTCLLQDCLNTPHLW